MSFRTEERSDRLFEFLGGAESDLLGRLDQHRLARCRVAPHAGRAFADHENAETGDADPLTLLEMLGDRGDEIVEHRLALFLRHFVTLGQRCREMLEADGGYCGFGCSSHIRDSL